MVLAMYDLVVCLPLNFLALIGWDGGVCISVYLLHLILRQEKPRNHSFAL
jgi:hypothetical protein